MVRNGQGPSGALSCPECENDALGAALINSDAAELVVSELETEDFLGPKARIVFETIRDLIRAGTVPDATLVRDRLRDGGRFDSAIGSYLVEVAGVPSALNAAEYVAQVRLYSQRRAGKRWAREVETRFLTEDSPAAVRTQALTELGEMQSRFNGHRADAHDLDLDEFLSQDEPEYDWSVRGLLERGDRLILTGVEGHGKSTLLHQLGVQIASGIHPFTLERIAPARVLLVDLENSRRQVRRRLRPLRSTAGEKLGPRQLIVLVRADGLDLLRREDAEWLRDRVAANEPHVVVIGPLYKCASQDLADEKHARPVAEVLDGIRVAHDVSLLIEAHSPYGPAQGRRPERPFGSSLWSRWPEFGINLAENGALRHWRGQREERAWPAALKRGGEWPWTPQTDPREVLWVAISNHANELGRRPSLRQLADALGASKSTVERTIADHKAEWESLGEELGE